MRLANSSEITSDGYRDGRGCVSVSKELTKHIRFENGRTAVAGV
jgi:hypothetical protein